MSKILSRFHRVFLHQQRLGCAFLTATIRPARRTCRENVMHHQDCITEKTKKLKKNKTEVKNRGMSVCLGQRREHCLRWKCWRVIKDCLPSTCGFAFRGWRTLVRKGESLISACVVITSSIVVFDVWLGPPPPLFLDGLLMGNLKVVPKCRRGYQIPRWVLMCITLLVIVVWWLSDKCG